MIKPSLSNLTTSWASPIVNVQSYTDITSFIEGHILFPISFKEKYQAPQWNFSQTYQKDTGEFDRKHINEYLIETDMLVLDYDETLTIEEFEKSFKDYEYYLYTTISHSPTAPRFRVILFLNNKISKENLQAFKAKKKYEKVFPGVDEKSFEINRWMIMPMIGNYYEYRVNQGKLYPSFELKEEPIAKIKKIISKDIKFPELYLKKVIPGIENEINAFNINLRGSGRDTYTQLFVFYMKLYKIFERCGKSIRECDVMAKDILLNYASNPLTISQIKAKKP